MTFVVHKILYNLCKKLKEIKVLSIFACNENRWANEGMKGKAYISMSTLKGLVLMIIKSSWDRPQTLQFNIFIASVKLTSRKVSRFCLLGMCQLIMSFKCCYFTAGFLSVPHSHPVVCLS